MWNWAVANISLLAVGASSPEILLALVETLLTLGQVISYFGRVFGCRVGCWNST